MLPYNNKITEIIKALRENQQRSDELADEYFKTLTTRDQQLEFQKILALHQDARVLYDTRHPNSDAVRAFEPAFIARARAELEPERRRATPEIVNIYIFNERPRSLWYDWWCWRMLTLDMMYSRPYYPSSHNHGHPNNNQSDCGKILLALVLCIGAVVSTLYSFVELGRCVEQLYYAEDVFGNLSRIVLAILGGITGGLVGSALLGAGSLAMPILGAVVGALIATGLAIWASKLLVESMHKASQSQSALDYDPRFCLSSAEQINLKAQGYDILAVSEAIREVAIAYDNAHKNAWSLTFWSKDNRAKAELIDLLRSLKKPQNDSFEFNNKTFYLMSTDHRPEVVIDTPLQAAYG